MKTRMILSLLLGLSLMAISATAGETAESVPVVKEWKNQTHCPVMGGAIDSSAYTDIQGQRVYHCCPGCSEKLAADPDSYFKKAAEDGIQFANIQTTCPICSMALSEDKAKATELRFEGRRLYFCSDGCAKSFQKQPQEYFKKMTAPSDEKTEDDHAGHSH